MKKLLSIIFITLITSTNAYSLSEEKLIELRASKARTNAAAGLIYDYCAGEDAILEMFYSKRCKCAIKAGKANNRAAVGLIVDQCGLKKTFGDHGSEFVVKWECFCRYKEISRRYNS